MDSAAGNILLTHLHNVADPLTREQQQRIGEPPPAS
jgi:hypothetical protein